MAFQDLKEHLGSTASVFQIIQFLSGVLVCRKFMKKGCSDDTSPYPFLCGFLSCALWTGYSRLLADTILIYTNAVGAFLFLAYSIIYYLYSSRKSKIMKLGVGVIVVLTIMQLRVSSLPNVQGKKQHLGIICSILTIAFYGAPFANLAQVIRQKSSESLPFPMIVTSFIVSLQWTLYGYLLRDPYVTYLNLVGFLLSLVQLSLFCVYPGRGKRHLAGSVTVLIPEHRINISS